MTGGADPFAETAGAYVLGTLEVDERRAFEAHLAGCAACRAAVDDVAHLPALLAAVPPGGLADPPPSVLAGLLREVARDDVGRRRGARRQVLTGAGVLGAAAAGFVAGALVLPPSAADDDAGPGGTTVALEATGDLPVSASLALEPTDWGTRLAVTCTYDAVAGDPYAGPAPAAVEYALVVRDAEGRPQQVATWLALPGHEVTVPASTALGLGDIAEVEMTTGGAVVLSAQL
ncbi:zf-HC2 domain-containing protein [Actinotalea fermentans]|uniref:Anti-sigma factor n=1 Tax=Actinotalea fermentans TaxID=43671 RepID=A0A511YYW6_9CELL|nr:zf-HC2 domain-containing protein [Actinotalea fermentans]GEN80390.1 anti-sigma factor [Actinotalea fermentans]